MYAHEGFIYPSRRRQSHKADSDELGIKRQAGGAKQKMLIYKYL